MTNEEAIRSLFPAAGLRDPAGGPYASNEEAIRDAVLGAVGLPLSAEQLLEHTNVDSGSDVFSPIPETRDAYDRWLTLRADPENAFGSAIGVPYAYDDGRKAPAGTIRDVGRLPLPGALPKRDAGFSTGVSSIIVDSTTPGVDVECMTPSMDAVTFASVIRTRTAGAGNYVYRVDMSPNYADSIAAGGALATSGLIARANSNTIQVELFNEAGDFLRRAVSGLASETDYLVIWGHERTSAGGNETQLWMRVYTTAGAFVNSAQITGTPYGPSDMAQRDTALHDCLFLRTYPDVRLTVAECDGVADGTDITAGGKMDRNVIGMRSGIERPGSGAFLVRATAGPGATKIARRPFP